MQDARRWIKAGIEYNDGAPAIGSVLTQGTSDWATGIFPGDPGEFWLRLTRRRSAAPAVFNGWPTVAAAAAVPFSGGAAKVGIMCCTPQRSGLRLLDQISLPPNDKDLHDLS